MRRGRLRAALGAWADLPPETRRRVLGDDLEPIVRAILPCWLPHPGQGEPRPEGDPWRVWAMIAGRGFGKTRAGAEWIWARVREGTVREGTVTRNCPQTPPLRIALVGATLEEVRRVMVEGESGLLAAARPGEAARWISTRGELHFPSGALAFAYSAARPSQLRGPQHHFAWCDELAKWQRGDETWDNLMLGLRLGARPRTVVTTTPRPVPLLRRILAIERCVATGGPTGANPHLSQDYLEAVTALYAGTRLARQELDGRLLEDVEGALWTREILEQARGTGDSPFHGRASEAGRDDMESDCPPSDSGTASDRLDLARTVVGVDPPASAGGDACGIVVCGLDAQGTAWVLADLTAEGLRPEGWASRVAAAAEAWGAVRVVAERNQGGDMVGSVLRAAGTRIPVRLVYASKGKAARAAPVALRFEKGEVRLAGAFPDLEDQLCGFTSSGYRGPGPSPDRADAMVWALTDLFERSPPRPRFRIL